MTWLARTETYKNVAETDCITTNEAGGAINNAAAGRFLLTPWQKKGARIATVTFAAGLGLDHDVIGLEHAAACVDIVYPPLLQTIAGG